MCVCLCMWGRLIHRDERYLTIFIRIEFLDDHEMTQKAIQISGGKMSDSPSQDKPTFLVQSDEMDRFGEYDIHFGLIFSVIRGVRLNLVTSEQEPEI